MHPASLLDNALNTNFEVSCPRCFWLLCALPSLTWIKLKRTVAAAVKSGRAAAASAASGF